MTLLSSLSGMPGRLVVAVVATVVLGLVGGTFLLHRQPPDIMSPRSSCDRVGDLVLVWNAKSFEHFLKEGGTDKEYIMASLDYALRQNGYTVLAVNETTISAEMAHKAAWIVMYEPQSTLRRYCEFSCKMVMLRYFGNVEHVDETSLCLRSTQQLLTAYPEMYDKFLGYFPHSAVLPLSRPEARARRVLILGEDKQSLEAALPTINALVSSGFEVHSTCSKECGLPTAATLHGKLNPEDLMDLLASMAAVLGVGEPLASPVPLEGLAMGAAFLNAIIDPVAYGGGPVEGHFGVYGTVHDALAGLGFPYVYNVDISDPKAVVHAAEMAVSHRFPSYVPWQYHPKVHVERVCSLFERQRQCQCDAAMATGATTDCMMSDYSWVF